MLGGRGDRGWGLGVRGSKFVGFGDSKCDFQKNRLGRQGRGREGKQ